MCFFLKKNTLQDFLLGDKDGGIRKSDREQFYTFTERK